MNPLKALIPALLLLGLGLTYLLGNGSAPLWDRDEPRYAMTSRNMVTSGDWVVPRQYDKPRPAKPAMIYWLQATSMKLLGSGDFAARLPSALLMTASLMVLLAMVTAFENARTALWATFIFGTSGLALMLGKMAITDATLTCWVLIGWACLYRMWRGDRALRWFILYGLSGGLAFLTKGPVALGIHGMTLAALGLFNLLERRWPAKAPWQTYPWPGQDRQKSPPLWLGITVAAVIALAIALPWFVLVQQRAAGMLQRTLDHDLWSRLTKGVDGQARPPGFYWLFVWGTYFPWSLLLPAAAFFGWRQRHRPLTRFAFAAVIGPWIMFECFVSKMPHWFLPMLAPLAILTAQWLVSALDGKEPDLKANGFRMATGIWLLVVLGLAAAPVVGAMYYKPGDWLSTLTLSGWLLVWGMTTAALLFTRRSRAAFVAMGTGMAVTMVLIYTVWAPRTWYLQMPRQLGADLTAAGADEKGESLMIGFREPSLAWYQGGTIREAESGELLGATGPQFFTVDESIFNTLPRGAKAMFTVRSSRQGVLYAQSRSVKTVLLVERRSPVAPATRTPGVQAK